MKTFLRLPGKDSEHVNQDDTTTIIYHDSLVEYIGKREKIMINSVAVCIYTITYKCPNILVDL